MHKFIEVILPLAFDDNTFTYLNNEGIEVGMQVVVSVKSKKTIGVVVEKHNNVPKYVVKNIDAIVGNQQIMTQKQIDFINWVAQYYICPAGQIFKQIIPSQIRNLTYKTPSCTGFAIRNNNIEEVEGLIKKWKAAQKAFSVLLAFGESGAVSKRQLLEKGATETGLKRLLSLEIVDKVEVPINVYSACVEDSFGELVSRTTKLYIGGTIDENIDLVRSKIKQANDVGKQCLVLTPNNFYAQRIVELLDDETIISFHAKCSPRQRGEHYLRILNHSNSVSAVVGTRLALFLPFDNIGEIIVLEESSFGYKSDISPRINGRDCAIVLADLYKANVTLTAVVPSLESYANVKVGRFEMVDSRKEQSQVKILEKGRGILFSKYMLNRIAETVDNGKQVVVFQNRRGFAGSVECRVCGYNPICPSCNVTMVLHQAYNRFLCHHCNYSLATFNRCPNCNSTEIQYSGMGTERVEEQLAQIFPNLKIARIDSDTAARTDAFGEIKEDIESAKSDIIVATQIIFNGLKIPNADLAVVVNADNMSLSTDFRTSEKIVATLEQLRKIAPNEIIIQASNSQNPIFKVVENDYLEFFDKELKQRAQLNYPPFSRLITIRMIGSDNMVLQKVAINLEEELLPIFKEKINPVYEPIGNRRIQREFVLEIMVKLPRNSQLAQYKEILRETVKKYIKKHGQIKFIVDVDPLY